MLSFQLLLLPIVAVVLLVSLAVEITGREAASMQLKAQLRVPGKKKQQKTAQGKVLHLFVCWLVA